VSDVFIDPSQLDALAIDLGKVAKDSGPAIREAVEGAAYEIKDAWREKAAGNPYAPAFASSITYDVNAYFGIINSVVEAEIGPSKNRRQGALGNLIEFGSRNNGARGYGAASLAEQADKLEQGLLAAIGTVL
jgi:hypothetical protein